MSETTFTFRLEKNLKESFAQAAKANDRTAAQLLRDFIKQQQDAQQYDQWFRQQVQMGIESANVGNLLLASDVEEKFAIKREAAQQKLGSTN